MIPRSRIGAALLMLALVAAAATVPGAGESVAAGTRTPVIVPDPPPAINLLPLPTVRQPAPKAKPVRQRVARPKVVKLDRLALGRADLRERRSTTRIAPGVKLTEIRRGTGKAPRNKIGSTQNGPWRVSVLTIDPEKADGRLATTHGPTVASTDRTTALSRKSDALAGVNASFFSLYTSRQYPGIPVGLTVSEGRVLSEPTGHSAEVTLAVDSKRNSVRIGKFDWTGEVRARESDAVLSIDLVNSPPVVPAGCRKAKRHKTCTKRGDLAAFTADFARKTPAGLGTEVVLDNAGCPDRIRNTRGVRLRGKQTSLQATGASATRLRRLAKAGCLDTDHAVRASKGPNLKLGKSVSAVTGRYRLLKDGRITAPRQRGGFFGRNPRTIAGVDAAGRIMFVTIDGRQRRSVGATLLEAARVAGSLGMVDVVNLDGGGSTTMAVRGRLVNRPSGSERRVSDALVWLAKD